MKKTFIIGITGISGSGKTTIATNLRKTLKNTKIIHVDNYWKEKKKIPKSFEKWKKWEHPSNINFKKLHKDLTNLKEQKKYNFIIIEGNLLFYYRKIRNLINLKIYLEIQDKLVTIRRIKKFGLKDNQEKYSKEIVTKEYKKYGDPTKKYTDLKFKGTKKPNDIIKKITQSLHLNKP